MHIWHFFSALFPKKACACANACTSFHASSCLFKLLASFNWIWLKSSHARNIAGCIEVVRWGKAGDPSVPSVKDNPREGLQQLLGRREYTWDKSIFPAVGISEAQPTLVLRTMTEIQIHRKPRFLHLTAYKDSLSDFPLFKKLVGLTNEDTGLLWLGKGGMLKPIQRQRLRDILLRANSECVWAGTESQQVESRQFGFLELKWNPNVV